MKLYLQSLTPEGNESLLPISEFPPNLERNRTALLSFFQLHAGREFGGREGRDWRICTDDRCLVPLRVNELIPGAKPGTMEYGKALIVK